MFIHGSAPPLTGLLYNDHLQHSTHGNISGATVTKIPVVAKLPLDLFRLYQVVQKLGGFAQVSSTLLGILLLYRHIH